MGPTGAGKSRLGGRIYELKKVRHAVKGEFVDVNCATLRGDGACQLSSATQNALSLGH
jgi:transcriptional regulatory protein RtcR